MDAERGLVRRNPAVEGDVVERWPDGLTIEEHLAQLESEGVVELVDDGNVIWCERCGAATDNGACGCMRSVKRVG